MLTFFFYIFKLALKWWENCRAFSMSKTSTLLLILQSCTKILWRITPVLLNGPVSWSTTFTWQEKKNWANLRTTPCNQISPNSLPTLTTWMPHNHLNFTWKRFLTHNYLENGRYENIQCHTLKYKKLSRKKALKKTNSNMKLQQCDF